MDDTRGSGVVWRKREGRVGTRGSGARRLRDRELLLRQENVRGHICAKELVAPNQMLKLLRQGFARKRDAITLSSGDQRVLVASK